MNTFKILSVNKNGSVSVVFSVDGKTQVLNGMPVGDKDALVQALTDYALAYEAGLQIAADVDIADEVISLLGKDQNIIKPK